MSSASGLPYGWWKSANFWAFIIVWPATVAMFTSLLALWWL